jgi:hypothetical protein
VKLSSIQMETFDYNGSGRWTMESIQRRYADHARRYHVEALFDLTPRRYDDGTKHWIYPVMERVIDGIGAGDAACIEIGIEFVESDEKFPFGKTLKSRTARTLRRALLTPYQVERIRRRVIGMLVAGHVPHEFRDYAKLLKKIGVGPQWVEIRDGISRTNPYVERFYNYINQTAEEAP